MRQLGLFAKYWEPGEVKTRLALSIGEQAASELYHQLLATTVHRFESFPAKRILAYSPPEKQLEFEQLAGANWDLAPQTAGHLGNRMQSYFADGLSDGQTEIILIGADSPTLSTETVQLAFEELQRHDVVIGPARDGGYYLIGCRQQLPDIFEEIHWGSNRVLPQTLEKLKSSELSYAVLPEWYDVDHLEDLITLQKELTESGCSHPEYQTLRKIVCQTLEAFRTTNHSE